MKRLPALQPLSREHQSALALARQAKIAGESGDPEACARLQQQVLSRFPEEIAPHFAVEESQLLPALERVGEAGLAARTRAEHAALHDALRTLATGSVISAGLIRFGELLTRHVRFEERELFEAAQAVLPAADLERVRQGSHGKGLK